MTIERETFEDKGELAKALAGAVAERINTAIETRGSAVIAVSGGTTPAKFFAALGKRKDVDWEKVTVTLVDERWVDETSDRSNAGLVNEKMLQGPAAVAHFIPLYSGGAEPDAEAMARTAEALKAIEGPLAAVVLGMGNDGHTASFFPGGDTLAEALTGTAPVLAIRAPGAGEPRVTLSLDRLLKTDGLFVHIEGEGKSAVLDTALGEGPVEDMPVRAVLRQDRVPVTIFWSP